MSNQAKNVWMKQHLEVSARMPDAWIMVIEGQTYIHPDHANEPLVRLHLDLVSVGYANGWI